MGDNGIKEGKIEPVRTSGATLRTRTVVSRGGGSQGGGAETDTDPLRERLRDLNSDRSFRKFSGRIKKGPEVLLIFTPSRVERSDGNSVSREEPIDRTEERTSGVRRRRTK